MSSPPKLSFTLHRSQSASSLLSLPVVPRDNSLHLWRQKDIVPSSEVIIDEQRPGAGQKEGFVLLSKEELKQQQSELESLISAAASTLIAGGQMEMRNFDRQETPQEDSDLTPANHNVQCNSTTSVDEQVEDSDESGEDSAPEELLDNSADEVSILKRLGLHRELCTEKEVESAFIHLSLAFKSDMFTLKKRLQVEERACIVAEENIQNELEGCKVILQKLKAVCTDRRRQEILKQLERNLQIIDTSITRVASSSEILGAVHQEARMSRGVQVMIQHVENLKCVHAKEHAELQEMKKIIQQNSRNRHFAEIRDDGDLRNKHQMMRAIHQSTARRRVSIAVIPKQLMAFHIPDPKMADSEERRTYYNSARISGENGQLFNSKLQNPQDDSTENHLQRTDSASSHQTLPSESSEKEDEEISMNGSERKRSLEEIANWKPERSEKTAILLTDTPDCPLKRLEHLPPSTGMWSSLSRNQKMFISSVLTLSVAWLLQLFSSGT
ncbi:inositol 1,4,5-triphosphate receptor associated 2 isoform X2 [Heptranchias perlo]|uniref:inositol 1,4,5-triphosphate receptor associated 2 isoform X2 n=1 Tax=Heptranchias perlo TaxID=212740 RepID=UPI003559C566